VKSRLAQKKRVETTENKEEPTVKSTTGDITGDNNNNGGSIHGNSSGHEKSMNTNSNNVTTHNVNELKRDNITMISYNVKSAGKIARQIREKLLDKNLNIFMCEDDIPLGKSWRLAIDGNAATCDFYVCLINDDWLKSRECQRETEIAINWSTHCATECLIIPVFLKYAITPETAKASAYYGSLYACNQGFSVRVEEEVPNAVDKVVDSIWNTVQARKKILEKEKEKAN